MVSNLKWDWRVLALLPALFFAGQALAGPRTTYPVQYLGGGLPMGQHRIRAALANDEVVFIERSRRIAVPLKDIVAISFGTEVRRRLGAAVLNVVPFMRLGETECHYVGVTWTDSTRGDRRTVEVLLQLDDGDYREFVSILERSTGRTAVDTRRVPTVVRYDL